MKKLILNYVGRNDNDNKLYQDTEGIYFEKDDYDDIIYVGKEYDNDPWGSIRTMKKYKDMEVITVGDENLPTEAERFNYMMLSRLQTDVKYYLGNGGKHAKHLWAENEQEHIKEMKKIYNWFKDDKKPKWLTWEQILEYEKELVG